jgi:hypothetical protein
MEVGIGSGGGARIVVRPLVRAHGDATDYWDGNWVNAEVAVRAGGFRGEYVACLRTEEFRSFRQDLERLYRDLPGRGAFRSMEEWLTVEVSGDGRGHFTGTARFRDRAGDGNLLECVLEFDQSDVPAMVQQLSAIESAFPVIGDPPG